MLLLLAVAVAGCGGDDGGDEGKAGATGAPATGKGAESAKVDIVDFAFEPPAITLKAGGEVTWLNSDVAPHTATADNRSDFDTGKLTTGKSRAISFDEPGTYTYFCVFHPFMKGTVEVVP